MWENWGSETIKDMFQEREFQEQLKEQNLCVLSVSVQVRKKRKHSRYFIQEGI